MTQVVHGSRGILNFIVKHCHRPAYMSSAYAQQFRDCFLSTTSDGTLDRDLFAIHIFLTIFPAVQTCTPGHSCLISGCRSHRRSSERSGVTRRTDETTGHVSCDLCFVVSQLSSCMIERLQFPPPNVDQAHQVTELKL